MSTCENLALWKIQRTKIKKKNEIPIPLFEFKKIPAQTHGGKRFADDRLRIRGFDLSLNGIRCSLHRDIYIIY